MARKEYNTEISKLKRRISALVADIDEINAQRSEIGHSELKASYTYEMITKLSELSSTAFTLAYEAERLKEANIKTLDD